MNQDQQVNEPSFMIQLYVLRDEITQKG